MADVPDAAMIGVRYKGDQVWIDVCDADGVHSALATPELDPRRIATLRAAVERVRKLHRQGIDSLRGTLVGDGECVECEQWWPCPTIRALDDPR